MDMLGVGSTGDQVRELQALLRDKEFAVPLHGRFDTTTLNAVRAFQSSNLDAHGQPLVVDGKVGPLTWWSLSNPKPLVVHYSAIDYGELPPAQSGGSPLARQALAAAVAELRAGAGEEGGSNRGPAIRKYQEPGGVPEGSPWCACFVSWCYLQASGGEMPRMPFRYGGSARGLLAQFLDRGWAASPVDGANPRPGDLVFWWRVRADGWPGHVGLVHQARDGRLYTVEGNRSPRVQGFSYVLSRMEKVLGFGRVRA
jgi:hypothetical protein